MQIKTEDLQKALKTIQPGIEKGGTVFFNGKYLVAGNDQIIVHCPLETDFTGGVNYDDLNKLIGAINIADIELINQENQLLIDAGNVAGGLKVVNPDEDIPFALPENCEWETLPADFNEALTLCSFSASTDPSLGLLTCLKVDKKNIISSDNFRVSKYTFTKPIKNTFMLSLTVINSLLKFNPVKVCQDISFAHFELDNGAMFSCRKAVGEYPNVNNLFNVTGETFELPKELRTAVKSVEFLADNENVYERFVTIETVDGKLRCGSENSRGWTNFVLDQTIDRDIKFRINPAFLYEILDKVTEITLGLDKALFKTDKFIHVMALPE
jgi:hypothetical protein